MAAVGTPFFLFFLWSKMQEPTPSPNQDKNWFERNLLGVLTYLPHTWSLHCWATQLQVCRVQVPFHNRSLTKDYHGVVVDVALMFLGVACSSFFFIST
jgi:hypothetical protein